MNDCYRTLLISYYLLPDISNIERHNRTKDTANKLISDPNINSSQKYKLEIYSKYVTEGNYKLADIFISKLKELYL
jgi:hypothetical protein